MSDDSPGNISMKGKEQDKDGLRERLLNLYQKQGDYGATDSSEEDSDKVADLKEDRSIHRVNPSNVWTSIRMPIGGGFLDSPSSQTLDEVNEYDLVPTELTDNMKLVTDPCLEPDEKGKLWYAEDAFYNTDHAPEYALTVNPDIYQRLFHEVYSSRKVPCGLYFCCHGGDGAHTGLSHDDHVDIRVAWTLASIIIGGVLLLNLME